MRYGIPLIVLSALGLQLRSAVAADPNEFAVGWPLQLTEGSEFYDVPLTADVYRHARSVSQMAILDANGEPMPFYRVRPEPKPVADRVITLSVSPVYRTESGEVIAGLTVETPDQVARLAVGSDATAEARIVAFVADAGELDVPVAAVDLDWGELEQPFMTSVVISHSEDLDHWEVIGRGTAASLAIDGARVRHSRVPVRGRAGGYYRIGWSDTTPQPWVLERLSLVVESEPDPAPAERVPLGPIDVPADTPSVAEEDTLYFDAGGLLPAGEIELAFARPNQWVHAAIFGSESLDGPWRLVVPARLYYRVELDGRQLTAPGVELRRTPVRYWKVVADRAMDREATELVLHFVTERLRFAANGSAPYQLVGGGLSTEAGPDTVLRQVWGQLENDSVGSVAGLGAMEELGGEAAFAAPFPWRSAFLWGALLLGALTVGWMALRLGREALGRS